MNRPAAQPGAFFVGGGTMKPTAPSYLERPADREFLEQLASGEFCFVLTSRQMGKSSLMARTAERLREGGALAAVVDLTAIGEGGPKDRLASASIWYLGMARAIAQDLRLKTDLRTWWQQRDGLPEMQRFTEFLEEIVLGETGDRRVVIFVDEIDATLRLPFTDDFFAGIRACYNARATKPAFERLTFALLGVASPSELIKDTSRTPYNIGRRIELNDLTLRQAAPLAAGLPFDEPTAQHLLARVLHWTGGQPYLTQKLCLELSRQVASEGLAGSTPADGAGRQVDRLVEALLFSPEGIRDEVHFKYIRDRVIQDRQSRQVLHVYRRVLRGEPVKDNPQSLAQNALTLAGLVRRVPQGDLQTRNPVYERVFGESWVQKALAVDPTRRRAFAVGALAILLVVVPLGILSQRKSDEASARARVDALVAARIEAVPEAIASLRLLRTRAEPLLRARFAETGARSASQLNAALGLAAFGDLAPLQQMTRRDPNPASRTAFIHGIRRWTTDPLRLVELLQTLSASADTDEAIVDFRSALCAAFALVEWKSLAPPDQEALRKTMERIYTGAPDGGSHSAAACALIRWGQPLPEIAERANAPAAGRGWFVNTVGLTMIEVPAGSFRMGHPQDAPDAAPHSVTLSKPIFVSDREVTVALFRQFTNRAMLDPTIPPLERPSDWGGEEPKFSPTPDCPVQQVSWYDAVKFCNWLSRVEERAPCYRALNATNWQCDPQANGYRLPTEAEWEYACRAVSEARFAFGDDNQLLGDYAWHDGNSENRTWPAGAKLPNLWGSFDQHGNLWEWCQDWYGSDYYRQSPPADPPGPERGDHIEFVKGPARVLRGGSWVIGGPAILSASFRYRGAPGNRYDLFGFRCVVGVAGAAPR